MPYLRHGMVKDQIYAQVEGLFEAYLEQNGHRKTPERFAILSQVYSYEGHFDVDTLYEVMEQGEYRVSRATLYNTLDLLLDCNLARRHQFGDQSAQYEKCHRVRQHDHVIIAETGEVIEDGGEMILNAIFPEELVVLHRDGFSGVSERMPLRLLFLRSPGTSKFFN